MSDHEHYTLGAAAIFSVILSIGAFLIATGPCALQDNLRSKVDHLEQRLDNIQDHQR